MIGTIIFLCVFVSLLYILSSKKKCPRCSGILKVDPYKYKNIIVWECINCKSSFETLKGEL